MELAFGGFCLGLVITWAFTVSKIWSLEDELEAERAAHRRDNKKHMEAYQRLYRHTQGAKRGTDEMGDIKVTDKGYSEVNPR